MNLKKTIIGCNYIGCVLCCEVSMYCTYIHSYKVCFVVHSQREIPPLLSSPWADIKTDRVSLETQRRRVARVLKNTCRLCMHLSSCYVCGGCTICILLAYIALWPAEKTGRMLIYLIHIQLRSLCLVFVSLSCLVFFFFFLSYQ